MTELTDGVRLGIDVGRARIGVAKCDADGMLATPVETVARLNEEPAGTGTHLLRIKELIEEHQPTTVFVGLPLSLAGGSTASTEDAVSFAEALQNAVIVPVRLVDERMTTVSASAQLHASGKRTREQRSVVDQVAAVILLQHVLDAARLGNDVSRPLGSV